MTALFVLGGILVLFGALALIKCSAEASYNENGFRWAVRVGGIVIVPRGKRKQSGREKEEKPAGEKTRSKPTLDQIRAYADWGLSILKRFLKSLRIDVLRVHFLSASDDPYDTAMAYGYAGTAMEGVTGAANGRIRHLDLHTDLDFDRTEPELDAKIKIFARVGKLAVCALYALCGWRKLKKQFRKSDEKEKEHVQSTDR